MTTIFAINTPEAGKLAEVVAIMREMGAPKVRALWCGDHWRAIEGSHRIAAAAQLGLTPEIVEYMGQGIDYRFED